jgi:hypothetical protein
VLESCTLHRASITKLVAPAIGHAQKPPEKLALAMVEKLIAGQFSEIVAPFNPEMAVVVSGPALKETWDQLTAPRSANCRASTICSWPAKARAAPRSTIGQVTSMVR